MKFTYRIREDLTAGEEGGERTVYGIDVFEVSGEGNKLVRTVKDILCERARAEQLAALCTELELDPTQLDDVITDTLAEV